MEQSILYSELLQGNETGVLKLTHFLVFKTLEKALPPLG